MKLIVDAENAIMGRLGSYVAKELLKGNEVAVVNSEKAIISGRKKIVVGKVQELMKKGGSSQKGPKFSRLPERLLKRKIRGMLPWAKAKGRAAFKRLRCYKGVGDVKKEELEQIKKLGHKKPFKYLTIEQIVKLV